jgi:hypothetical protein
VVTLENTINHLKLLNINVKYVILAAGYYSEENL